MNIPGSGAGSAAFGAIAREVNARIREIALERWVASELPYQFFCVCGCFGPVTLIVAQYDACGGDVLREGHTARA